jgi:hypothetical protein
MKLRQNVVTNMQPLVAPSCVSMSTCTRRLLQRNVIYFTFAGGCGNLTGPKPRELVRGAIRRIKRNQFGAQVRRLTLRQA